MSLMSNMPEILQASNPPVSGSSVSDSAISASPTLDLLTSASPKPAGCVSELILNGKPVHTLSELRENFTPEEILKTHMDGSLLQWLDSHFYEKEAMLISQISANDSDMLRKICAALGVSYADNQDLSEEERATLERKRVIVSAVTSNPEVLTNLHLVAMNQEEMSELLHRGEKQIYLCENTFSLPIRLAGVTYIGIGNVILESPYTEAQYKKAGITIEGITLPTRENPDTVGMAREAARDNGYDDFPENHSALTWLFHEAMKVSTPIVTFHHIDYDMSIATKFFNSKSECKSTRDKIIRKAYDQAQSYVTPDSSRSLSKEQSDLYGKFIRNAFSDVSENLAQLCKLKGRQETWVQLKEMVSNAAKNLRSRFDEELRDSSDYYSMYDFNYFIEQAGIEEHDYRIGDDFFTRAIEGLFSESVQYTIPDLCVSLNELQNDLTDHINAFCNAALREYTCYVGEIEDLLEKIGKGLPESKEQESVPDYISRCIETAVKI